MNFAAGFAAAARERPGALALALADGRGGTRELSFGELDRWSDGYARGLREAGVARGDRLLLLMRPDAEFIALVLGLFKAGVVLVLVDPGMKRASLFDCIRRAAPDAMVGAPEAHLLPLLSRDAFATVRRRWLAGWSWMPGAVERLRRPGGSFPCEDLDPGAGATVVFTSGSTGIPKGVAYTHANYLAQLDLLRRRFSVRPDEVALPGYLPFAILCLGLGNACAVPHFQPARPASVEPEGVLDLVRRYRPSYGLGSPAFWGRVGEHCRSSGVRLDGLRRLLLFGAEVQEDVLRSLRACLPPEAEVHTPYGSTEAQPVTTISDRELLSPELVARRERLGVCVGAPLSGVEVELVRVDDGPLDPETRGRLAGPFEVGEVAVRGAMVSEGYFGQPDQDRLHKIGEGPGAWHRMGDCGCFDEEGRLWLVGRKAHRVSTADGVVYPLPVEAFLNRHPAVRRSALVGVGPPGAQRPVAVVELVEGARGGAREQVVSELLERAKEPAGGGVRDVLVHPKLPVDHRHNAKIQREELARWAAGLL